MDLKRIPDALLSEVFQFQTPKEVLAFALLNQTNYNLVQAKLAQYVKSCVKRAESSPAEFCLNHHHRVCLPSCLSHPEKFLTALLALQGHTLRYRVLRQDGLVSPFLESKIAGIRISPVFSVKSFPRTEWERQGNALAFPKHPESQLSWFKKLVQANGPFAIEIAITPRVDIMNLKFEKTDPSVLMFYDNQIPPSAATAVLFLKDIPLGVWFFTAMEPFQFQKYFNRDTLLKPSLKDFPTKGLMVPRVALEEKAEKPLFRRTRMPLGFSKRSQRLQKRGRDLMAIAERERFE